MNETTPRRPVVRWVGIALPVLMATAVLIWLFRRPQQPSFEGRPLGEWLKGPVTIASGSSPENTRRLALGFHDAGPAGIRLLLDELEAPCRRSDWIHSWLSALLPTSARSGSQAKPKTPDFRAFEAYSLLAHLPPPDAAILAVLTNRFLALGRALDGVPPPVHRPGPKARWLVPDSAELLAVRQNFLHVLARWIAQDREAGGAFLSRQLLESEAPMVQGSILLAISDWLSAPTNRATASFIPGIVQAARHPANELSAASLLTSLHIEPAMAIPILVRHTVTNPVSLFSRLAEWGTNVQPWLPELLPLTTNADPHVSFQAEIAVQKIRGK